MEFIFKVEEISNLKINSAYTTIPGKYITIVQNSIVKELKDKFAGITLKDVQNAIMQAKDIEIPEGKTIIDIVPSEIVLDNGKVVSITIDGYQVNVMQVDLIIYL